MPLPELLLEESFVFSSLQKVSLQSLRLDQINWERVKFLLEDHRIAPWFYQRLLGQEKPIQALIPQAFWEYLEQAYYQNLAYNSFLLHEMVKVQQLLEDKGITPLFFKGVELSALAYKDLGSRVVTDVDMIVPRHQIHETIRYLEEAGFREEIAGKPAAHNVSILSFTGLWGNAHGYQRVTESGQLFSLDVHWAVAPRYFQLRYSADQWWERSRVVSIQGKPVRVLSPEDRFILLSIHGAKHAWMWLRLIADIAAYLENKGDKVNWSVLFERAKGCRCGRMVALSLVLAHQLLKVPLSVEQKQFIAQYGRMDQLVDWVCQLLLRRRPWKGASLFNEMRFQLAVRDRLWEGLGSCYYLFRITFWPVKPAIRLETGAHV